MSIAVGIFAAPAGSVIRYRRGATTRDSAGDQHAGAWDTGTPLDGVDIVPGTATEDTTTGFTQLDDTATLYGPDGLDLTAADEVLWRSIRWTVQGNALAWPDPLAIGVGSVVMELRKRAG